MSQPPLAACAALCLVGNCRKNELQGSHRSFPFWEKGRRRRRSRKRMHLPQRQPPPEGQTQAASFFPIPTPAAPRGAFLHRLGGRGCHASHLGELSQNFARKQLETERKGQVGENEVFLAAFLLQPLAGRWLTGPRRWQRRQALLPPASTSPARGFSLSPLSLPRGDGC